MSTDYYKAVAVLPDGRMCSLFAGEHVIYEIGRTLAQEVQPYHGGGYYVCEDVEQASDLNVNVPNDLSLHTIVVIRCQCGGNYIRYKDGKLAFSRITPVEVVGTISFKEERYDILFAKEYSSSNFYARFVVSDKVVNSGG